MKIRCVNPQYGGASHDSLVWNLSTARADYEHDFLAGIVDFR